MAYIVYLDRVALPVTPHKIQMKIKNQNKTITLINDGEVNMLKSAGLTEITFAAMIPHVRYPFGYYPGGFRNASYYLEKLEQLKVDKEPFQFICSRTSPGGGLLFDTNLKVSIEDYDVEENALDGQSLNVAIKLKQWKDYGTKTIKIEPQVLKNVATVQEERSTETAPKPKTYTVKSGDTLWNISKKNLGDGSKYNEIASLNNLSNPNLIFPGQILSIPS